MNPANLSDDSADIERLIRGAGDYVQPSRDLRPRTLESARQCDQQRRGEHKFGLFVLAVLVLCLLRSPVYQCIDTFRHHVGVPTAVELQQHALDYGSQPEVGAEWGLTEAFTQLRQTQADRLGATRAQFR